MDGEDIRDLPLVDRKARLKAFLVGAPKSLRFSDHQIGQGSAFHRLACEHGLEASSQSGRAGQVRLIRSAPHFSKNDVLSLRLGGRAYRVFPKTG